METEKFLYRISLPLFVAEAIERAAEWLDISFGDATSILFEKALVERTSPIYYAHAEPTDVLLRIRIPASLLDKARSMNKDSCFGLSDEEVAGEILTTFIRWRFRETGHTPEAICFRHLQAALYPPLSG